MKESFFGILGDGAKAAFGLGAKVGIPISAVIVAGLYYVKNVAEKSPFASRLDAGDGTEEVVELTPQQQIVDLKEELAKTNADSNQLYRAERTLRSIERVVPEGGEVDGFVEKYRAEKAAKSKKATEPKDPVPVTR